MRDTLLFNNIETMLIGQLLVEHYLIHLFL